jgi:protein-disulfide isomerase/uncharacterized membrane protein
VSEYPTPGDQRPDDTTTASSVADPQRSMSLPAYLAGLVLLGVAIASSLTLVMGHIGALGIPGCGHNSPCAQAASSAWGRVPFVGWPTSFLGLAYFVGAAAAWSLARGGLSRWHMGFVRLGALASLVFLVVIAIGNYTCGYCLASHAGNLGFWILAERQRRRAPATVNLRPVGVLVLSFLVVSAVLAVTEWREKEAVAERGEQDRSESVARIIAAANEPDGGEPTPQAPTQVPASTPEPGGQMTGESTPGTGAPVAEVQPPTAPQSEAGQSQPPWRGGFRGRYLTGPDPAAIRIVMFTDYQCTDCNRIEDDVRRVLAAHKDVSLSIKQFPMCKQCNKHFDRDLHPNACWAARAAEAAGLLAGNDGFWKMHWWLFDHDGGFTDAELTAGLQELGFDRNEFVRVMTGPETLTRVQADIEEAMWVGIHYTPMIFVNGVELKGFNVTGALERTVAEVAQLNPPPRTHTADHPPAALQKYLDDWRAGPVRSLPADAHPHSLGPADAKVEIVVWGDLVEVGTAKADSTIRALVAGRRDVSYNFRHYPANQACNPVAPRTIFANSCLASKAAEAALLLGGPDAYWRMQAWLAQTRERVDEPALRAAAQAQSLDPDRLLAAMEQPEVAAAIEEDSRAGQQMGLTGIPLVYIDRRFVPRWEREGESLLDRMVDLAAGEATKP